MRFYGGLGKGIKGTSDYILVPLDHQADRPLINPVITQQIMSRL